jgi:hypothetical protein
MSSLYVPSSTVLVFGAANANLKHVFHTSPYPVILSIAVMSSHVMICYAVFMHCSTVLFKDAVKAISKHGFRTSPYPVILTIENHAGVEQQATVAADLHSVLGHRLFEPAPEQLQSGGQWLSPEALKHKVGMRINFMAVGRYSSWQIAKCVGVAASRCNHGRSQSAGDQ